MSTQVASCQPLDPHRRDAVRLLDPPLDLLDEGAHVAGVLRAGDDEGVDHAEELPHGEHDRSRARAWHRPTRRRWPPRAAAGRARPTLGSMEHVQDPHREPEGTREDGAAGDGPALTGPSRHLQLRPSLGPALRRVPGSAPARGLSDSSVDPAGMALI